MWRVEPIEPCDRVFLSHLRSLQSDLMESVVRLESFIGMCERLCVGQETVAVRFEEWLEMNDATVIDLAAFVEDTGHRPSDVAVIAAVCARERGWISAYAVTSPQTRLVSAVFDSLDGWPERMVCPSGTEFHRNDASVHPVWVRKREDLVAPKIPA